MYKQYVIEEAVVGQGFEHHKVTALPKELYWSFYYWRKIFKLLTWASLAGLLLTCKWKFPQNHGIWRVCSITANSRASLHFDPVSRAALNWKCSCELKAGRGGWKHWHLGRWRRDRTGVIWNKPYGDVVLRYFSIRIAKKRGKPCENGRVLGCSSWFLQAALNRLSWLCRKRTWMSTKRVWVCVCVCVGLKREMLHSPALKSLHKTKLQQIMTVGPRPIV